MAGNYPDVPSWRMAYDVDGTQGYKISGSGNTIARIAAGTLTNMNGEAGSGIGNSDGETDWVTFIFPEQRDLDAYLVIRSNSGGNPSATVFVSADTTNGVDGTWTSLGTTPIVASANKPNMRTTITANTVLGIKAIRFVYTNPVNASSGGHNRSFHLFGEPAPGENLQRLEIWHPTLDQRLGPADLDWGDVPRNSSEIRSFRIKNMHPTLTANSVRAAMSILTDTTPSVVGQMSISKDGGSTWGAQQTLTSPLGPEAISPVLQIRRQTPANATLSLWWYRVFADCSSWT